ncbi:MAG: 16S rRNA (guanine(527)-N(7))-methyltransferase RsmG [Schwartzia sp.]|nr:16S rRNA (guanine(527)-N(7))-methyltransferase RsmG [Schwartzia sp. (in: firmicutes)]
MKFIEDLRECAEKFGITLDDYRLKQFDTYFGMLIDWNEKINLTAITEPHEVAVKHFIDSLSCHDEKYFSDGASVIDVGTGAGFPGIPLKIFRPDIKLTLLDSLQKRVNFLSAVCDTLSIKDVEIIHARAEDGARQKEHRERYDVAVSRAVARMSVLAEYALPYVRTGGYFLALKGAKFDEEADEAKRAIATLGGKIEKISPVKLPTLDDKRAIIAVKKIKATPKTYPRKAGTPEKKPL